MMHVAILAPHFPEYTLEYANSLAKHCRVTVCVDEGQVKAEYGDRPLPWHENLEINLVRFKSLIDLWRISYLIARRRPTIVHFQEAVGPRRGFFNAFIAGMMRPVSHIALTVHDPSPHTGSDEQAARRTARFRNYVRRNANLVIVHGAFCLAEYKNSGPPASQTVVLSEHGLILKPSSKIVDAQRSPHSTLRLLFFGRMEAYKGLEVICTAAEMLHKEGLEFELLIAGKGTELDRLMPRFDHLPEVRIRNGFIPSVDLIEAIQEADCVLLPYINATQSGVAAAAFANGRYVIASRTGGLVDIVEHDVNGLLIEPGNPQSLADAIKRLVGNPKLRSKLREGARQTSETLLDWDRIATGVYGAFRNLASLHRGK
ncbi:glycosyltransferase family 4 protein [Microvirga aerilata]|uniref:Glycosyltransferase family 4 protein n=1 Tax=Microvirga aerilata TaxID=670292 RepID=A0A937D4L8_9HYPH|nr:glycosyltransferase family 4 protein [Microvirga aerilata]MBL0407685.1 glycosyltransferase family 4 protein [Microvirga aerilata]